MRLIDADALRQDMWDWAEGIFADKDTKYEFNSMLDRIDAQPIIEAVPVVHGRWITNSDYPDMLICSECGYMEDVWWADKGTPYCPNCPAKMDKEADG